MKRRDAAPSGEKGGDDSAAGEKRSGDLPRYRGSRTSFTVYTELDSGTVAQPWRDPLYDISLEIEVIFLLEASATYGVNKRRIDNKIDSEGYAGWRLAAPMARPRFEFGSGYEYCSVLYTQLALHGEQRFAEEKFYPEYRFTCLRAIVIPSWPSRDYRATLYLAPIRHKSREAWVSTDVCGTPWNTGFCSEQSAAAAAAIA
ncbi:hypothetical protein KM043_010232 [Ampulex compressa]|nr:hypothetical protein KM043_010232 [Ampulex compressa]